MSFTQKRNVKGPADAARRVSNTMLYVPGGGQNRAGDLTGHAELDAVRVQVERQPRVAREAILVGAEDDVRHRAAREHRRRRSSRDCRERRTR